MTSPSGISSCGESDDDFGHLQLSGRTSTPRRSPGSRVLQRPQLSSRLNGTNNADRSPSGAQERVSNASPEIAQILKIVQGLDNRMTKLERRQDESEKRQESDKKRQKTKSTPASNYMKKQVRYGYANGVEKGLTWNIAKGKKCTNEDNIAMTKHIETCVQGVITNPNSQELTDAIGVYFRSRYEDSKRDKSLHNKRQLKYSRKAGKRDRRRKACESKKSYSQEDRDRYLPVLQTQYMSSEDEEDGTMVVHHLSWESREFKKLKRSLDKKYMSKATVRTERQMYERIDGDDSTRPQPKISAENMWIVQ